MPAEWEPHHATWLAWPHERTDWPGKFAPIPWVYADIVRHLARVERVRILVQERRRARPGPAHPRKKRRRDLAPWISSSSPPTAVGLAISAQSSSSNRARRPSQIASPTGTSTPGPNTTTGKKTTPPPACLEAEIAIASWEPHYTRPPRGSRRRQHRSQRRRHTHHHRRVPAKQNAGTQSRLHPRRLRNNIPRLFRRTERSLARAAASPATTPTATWTIWPASSIQQRWSPSWNEPTDANYEPLQENLARLRKMKDQDGHPLRIETLPMPAPVYFEGQRLPASYANFYIANG